MTERTGKPSRLSEQPPAAPDSLLDGLPTPTREDIEALRAARRHRLSMAQLTELWEALPKPTAEEMRRRPVFRGEPFRF